MSGQGQAAGSLANLYGNTVGQLSDAAGGNPAQNFVWNQSAIPGGAAGLGMNTNTGNIWGANQMAGAAGELGNWMGQTSGALSKLPAGAANTLGDAMGALGAKVGLNTSRGGSLAQQNYNENAQQVASNKMNNYLSLMNKQQNYNLQNMNNANRLASSALGGVQKA